jgi:hypothetical protein
MKMKIFLAKKNDENMKKKIFQVILKKLRAFLLGLNVSPLGAEVLEV